MVHQRMIKSVVMWLHILVVSVMNNCVRYHINIISKLHRIKIGWTYPC